MVNAVQMRRNHKKPDYFIGAQPYTNAGMVEDDHRGKHQIVKHKSSYRNSQQRNQRKPPPIGKQQFHRMETHGRSGVHLGI